MQEKVQQIRQRVADTLGDGTHVALTQAIPGMLEVGRLHGIPGSLKVRKLFARGHAQVVEPARRTVVVVAASSMQCMRRRQLGPSECTAGSQGCRDLACHHWLWL